MFISLTSCRFISVCERVWLIPLLETVSLHDLLGRKTKNKKVSSNCGSVVAYGEQQRTETTSHKKRK